MRERWLGATGLRVPEIAVEGELELPEDVLWLESTTPRSCKEAHAAGRPVAAHADTPEGVRRLSPTPRSPACSSPPSSRELVELDLTALTYD